MNLNKKMNLNKINEFGCDESTAALYGYNIIVRVK